MAQHRFLDKIAKVLLNDYHPGLEHTVVVLPNKRARIFLSEALRKQAGETLFSPTLVSIEDFIVEISGLRTLDSAELLFEFYDSYRSLTENDKQQSFEVFANWAVMLLQDFNEIDRYLLEPNRVFSYLKDIEDIKRWGIEVSQKTALIEKYVYFWQRLPLYYQTFYAQLLEKGTGYQGMIYREAAANIEHFTQASLGRRFLFAGFNALNKAEEKIIQHLLTFADCRIFWDADSVFLNDPYHDAGLFLRRFRDEWPYYRSHPFEWISNNFSQAKTIEVIGTPKSVGQARIVGSLIEKLSAQDGTLPANTAVVLGDENLLLPVLDNLPASVVALNITMGYRARNNPVQVLIAALFRLHVNALKRSSGGSYTFYYRDVLDVLSNPFLRGLVPADALVQGITRNNLTFISQRRLRDFFPAQPSWLDALLGKWDTQPLEALLLMSKLLIEIKGKLSNDNNEERISQAFVFAVFQIINKLINYTQSYGHAMSLETVFSLYKQLVELAEVSFEGEPLDGLQVMGVLESRVLDFDTVIITSVNEGSFPAGKSSNSFIPNDVKRELGLPTYKEKDAIYTYHFYHLLQRASKVYLIYNTESEGIDAGERSRFITQLEVEKQPLHAYRHEVWNAEVPDKTAAPTLIHKSARAMKRLREICDEGFSPSAITSYIRNPIDFYLRKVLRIRETDEVEENIAVNTLGTIIHGALEALFKPFVGIVLTQAHLEECFAKLDGEVHAQFLLVYKEGEIKKGRNLLAYEVARRNVLNYLKHEKQLLAEGDQVTILALEKTYERLLEHPALPYPVLLKGNIDRIEKRNGKTRILDYKTGKVEERNVTLKTWEGLTSDLKSEKIIQVLAYAFLYGGHQPQEEIEVGIISFKNLRSGFLTFKFKGEVQTSVVTEPIMAAYLGELALLLAEILDAEIPFSEKTL